MTIDNLNELYSFVMSNGTLDFYISNSKMGNVWYIRAVYANTNKHFSMAGFNTKKTAKDCIHTWATWMRA